MTMTAFLEEMGLAIYRNIKLAITYRLTNPGHDEISMERGICLRKLAASILSYWEGKSTLEQVRMEMVADGWVGQIDEVIALSTPQPFLKDVKVIIRMPNIPRDGYVIGWCVWGSKTKFVRIAKHLWLADAIASNTHEPLFWRCSPDVQPNEFVLVLVKGLSSKKLVIFMWTGEYFRYRRAWQPDAFLKRIRWTPTSWLTEELD